MLAAATLLTMLALPQGTPLTTGDPGKLNYIVHKRLDGPPGDADGGGTEFARFDVAIYLQLREGTEPTIQWRSMCINACQGPPPNHKDHSVCDRLCDLPCEAEHSFSGYGGGMRTPLVEFRPGEYTDAWRFEYGEVMVATAKRGMSWPGFSSVLEAVKEYTKAVSLRYVEFDMGHLVRPPHTPCAFQEWALYSRRYDLILQVTVTRMAVPKGGGAPAAAGTLYDKLKIKVGFSDAVDNDPTALVPGIDCACEKKHRTATGSSPPKISFGNDFKILPTETRTATYAGLGKLGFASAGQYAIAGVSMNHVSVSFRGSGARALFLPAGTRLVPNEPGTQEMVVAENAEIVQPIIASIGGFAIPPQQVRVLCAEMAKKEPTPRTKFEVSYPRDDALRRLANITADSRFRGPWDQARIWIHTNDASFEEIFKRLRPPIGRGTYVRLLHDVVSGPVSASKAKKLAGFLKPEFLAELNPDEDSAEWALQTLLERDPKAAANALRGVAAEWLKNKVFGLNYLAIVVSRLTLSDSADARRAAREILLKDVPSDRRSEVSQTAALDTAILGLLSRSEDEIMNTLEVYNAYGVGPAKPWMEALSKAGPSERIRKAAGELLARQR